MFYNGEIDLHFYNPEDTLKAVEDMLNEAIENHLRTVRIIHGKGKSVKKFIVWKFLDNNPYVIKFGNDGHNWGATLVHLKIE